MNIFFCNNWNKNKEIKISLIEFVKFPKYLFWAAGITWKGNSCDWCSSVNAFTSSFTKTTHATAIRMPSNSSSFVPKLKSWVLSWIWPNWSSAFTSRIFTTHDTVFRGFLHPYGIYAILKYNLTLHLPLKYFSMIILTIEVRPEWRNTSNIRTFSLILDTVSSKWFVLWIQRSKCISAIVAWISSLCRWRMEPYHELRNLFEH